MIKFLQILVANLPLVGGQNIYSEAAQLEAKQRLALLAENDVVLSSGRCSTKYAVCNLTLSEALKIQVSSS